MNAATEPRFEPPGPGSWSIDYTHWTRPVTRFQAEVFPEQFVRGFGESLKRYGLLLDYLDWQFVNGFPYYCPRAVGAPEDAVGHPPKHVWDELMRTDPESSSASCGARTCRFGTKRRSLQRFATISSCKRSIHQR